MISDNISCSCCKSFDDGREVNLGPRGPEPHSSKLPAGPWKSRGSQASRIFGKALPAQHQLCKCNAVSRKQDQGASRGGSKTPTKTKEPSLCDASHDKYEMKITNGPKAPAIGFADLSKFGCQNMIAQSPIDELAIFFDHSPNAKGNRNFNLFETPKCKAKHHIAVRNGGA